MREHVVIHPGFHVRGAYGEPTDGVLVETNRQHAPAPSGRVSVGDLVWIKHGAAIAAVGRVTHVQEFRDSPLSDVRKATAGSALHDLDQYWDALTAMKGPLVHAVVIRLGDQHWLRHPYTPSRRSYGSSWIVFESSLEAAAWLSPRERTMSHESVTIREPALLLTLNQLYREGMSRKELYEATRGTWVVGPRRDSVEIAMAVFQGIVREVYRIHAWHPAGTLDYVFRDPATLSLAGRWEFEGEVATDLRQRYVGRWVGKGNQNPVRYVNA